MSKSKTAQTAHPASVAWAEYRDGKMRDPAFRAAYEALEPEFDLIRQLVDLRLQCGLSQRELAKRAKMQQPTIARLESGRTASLRTLRRVAEALNAEVRVELVPRRAQAGSKPKAGTRRA